ncbi:MAG: LemA family protein, partial [Candidatus Micrarchaeia archaeon]
MLELIFGLIVLILIIAVLIYNNLIILRNNVENAWAQIDVQLKRRADLIPNLVNAVKGYMKHEKETLENITKARAALMSAKTPKEAAKADNMLSSALKSLFAVAENYPNLRASENFLRLQEDLSDTENKVAY